MVTSGGILAAFVSPGLFLSGAAAIAAPVLIHLLARRRFRRIRWAAMDFLVDAERRNRRRVRMEEWILLALRCLAVLLIAFVISRPFIRPGGLASALGGSRQTERIFILDDSFSMAYAAGDRSSFELAKGAVRTLIDAIRRETPDDTVTILRMSATSSPVESGTYLDPAQTEALLARLDALTPSNRAIEVSSVIAGTVDYLERSESIVGAAVYFISDFQAHNWLAAGGTEDGEESGEQTHLFDSLTDWAGDKRACRIVCINVADPNAANTAVTELRLAGGRLVAGYGRHAAHEGGELLARARRGSGTRRIAWPLAPAVEGDRRSCGRSRDSGRGCDRVRPGGRCGVNGGVCPPMLSHWTTCDGLPLRCRARCASWSSTVSLRMMCCKTRPRF